MSNFSIPATVEVIVRGHRMTLSTDGITDVGAESIFHYGVQRGVNDPLGKLGKGFKADSVANIAAVEEAVNASWTAMLTGFTPSEETGLPGT